MQLRGCARSGKKASQLPQIFDFAMAQAQEPVTASASTDVFVRSMARAITDDGAELASGLLHLLAPAQPIVRYEGPLRALLALLRAHKLLIPTFVAKELTRDAIELVGREEGRLHSLYARLMEELAGTYVSRSLGSILQQVAAGTVSDMPQETDVMSEEKPLEQSLQYTSFQVVLAIRNSLVFCPQSIRHAIELARAELSKTVHYTLVERVVGKLLLSLLFAPAVCTFSCDRCLTRDVDSRSSTIWCSSARAYSCWQEGAA